VILKYNISNEQIRRAKKAYDFTSLKNSITSGKSNIYGAIGEIMVNDIFKTSIIDNTFDYDIIIEGIKIDVKTKKLTEGVSPNLDFHVTIPAFNIRQKCNYYFFCTVSSQLQFFYLLGYMEKDIFLKKSLFKKKGEKDIYDFTLRCDCYTMQVKDLKEFDILKLENYDTPNN